MIVGRTVNRLRNAAGLTQERLAERVGIDMRSLQRIEAGAWNMTVDYLERLRDALRCRWIDLIEGLDSPLSSDKPATGRESARRKGTPQSDSKRRSLRK